MHNKNLSQTISEFSKKLLRFNNAEKQELELPKSSEQILQTKINDFELERKERILKQINAYLNPINQELEDDENYLLEAYNLFKKAFELNENSQQPETKLASLKIKSPLCQKQEYSSGNDFSFLRIWFVHQNPSADFIPAFIFENEKKYLEFIPFDEYEFSRLEKEILQVLS